MKITNNYIKINLRRIFLMSDTRKDAFNNCKIKRGQYKCFRCGNIFKRTELECHHTAEISDSTDWNTYINKLFCDVSELLIVCKLCHLDIHKIHKKK